MKVSLENSITKWFMRGITGVILLSYTARFAYSIIIDKEITLDSTDWYLILGASVVWVAFESAREWLKTKANKE